MPNRLAALFLSSTSIGVKARARELRAEWLPAAAVFKALVGAESRERVKRSSTQERKLALGEGRHAEIRHDGRRVVIELEPSLLPAEQWDAFEEVLRRFIG